MGRKPKYTDEQKLWAVTQYLSGSKSAKTIAIELGMPKDGRKRVLEWVEIYKYSGSEGLRSHPSNNAYSKEFKEKVCQSYLQSEGSYTTLAARYGIPSTNTIRNWVKKYTGDMNKLEDYIPQSEVYMAPRKKTTQEERREIVDWYLENGCSYKETAAKFGCSYSQVRDWVIKFRNQGENGLEDRRGRRKPETELDAVEAARRENERLKAIIRHQEMEIELLKKAEEAERRWSMDTAESNETRFSRDGKKKTIN